MFVIMGATGHVGSAVAKLLLDSGKEVTIVTRDVGKAESWRARGAKVVGTDIDDVASLRAAFRRGRRAFLLNPPADTSGDTDSTERRTIGNILAALESSGLEKVVAESTGGAQPGERLGDLGTLWEFEEGLRRQTIPAAINRAAYYMSNWDPLFEVARKTGTLPTMYPADFAFPMVAPQDLGRAATERLLSGDNDVGVRYAVGPRRYSSADVADVFAAILGRPVTVLVTPPAKWKDAFVDLGFSNVAAESYAGMVGASLNGGFDVPHDAWRGTTTLEAYCREVAAAGVRQS